MKMQSGLYLHQELTIFVTSKFTDRHRVLVRGSNVDVVQGLPLFELAPVQSPASSTFTGRARSASTVRETQLGRRIAIFSSQILLLRDRIPVIQRSLLDIVRLLDSKLLSSQA